MGSQPAPPSSYPLPSTLSHGLFPLAPTPRLCAALARIGRRRHTDGRADGQRAMQGCLPTPAPCWHGAWAWLHAHTNTDVDLTQIYLSHFTELSHIQTEFRRRAGRGLLPGGGGGLHMQILPQTTIDAAHACLCVFNKRKASHSHDAPLSLSVTDVYTLISNWGSTCALQKTLLFHTQAIINIYERQSHIHGRRVVYL